MASLGMVFEGYPDEVICFVTDPKTGIQRRSKWPPTISEIVEACDQHVAYLKQCERFKNWGNNDTTLLVEGPKSDRPTLEQLKEKYGDNWGIDPTGGEGSRNTVAHAVPSWDEIVKFYSANPERTAHLRDGLVNLKALRE